MAPAIRKHSRWLFPTVASILIVVVALLWSQRQSVAEPSLSAKAAPEAVAAEPARVTAVRVERTDLSLRAQATGYLEPWKKVEIKAEASGRVVERPLEEGGRVGAGQLLVRLDDRELQIELEEARAEWLKSQAGFAVNYQEFDSPKSRSPAAAAPDPDEIARAERLVREGLLAQRELDELRRRHASLRLLSGASQGEVRAASSGLAQAEQRVERSRLALERTRIAAPFSGRVADLEVEVGQQIGPGETLFTLLQDDRLKVDVDVLEADIVRLRPGAPARVTIPSADGLVLEGSVYAINPRVDSTTGTGKVTVAIDNLRGLLLSGLFANVELETRRLPGRLIVPAEALLARQGRDLVFRIEKGRALWTYVTVGERSGEQVEITEGLSQGDLIAAGQHFALAHEAPVEAVLTEGAGAARR